MPVIYLQLTNDPNAPYVAYNWTATKPPVVKPTVNSYVYNGNI